jgi:hypothetical protein
VAHPIQTQAITYIVQRLASLATLFYLGAVVCYAKGPSPVLRLSGIRFHSLLQSLHFIPRRLPPPSH